MRIKEFGVLKKVEQIETNLVNKEISSEDLFNKANSTDISNMEYIDIDDNGNPIFLSKSPTSFEKLYCAEYDRYLVPLFADNSNEQSFLGNGVIVDNHLITAAHVVVCNKCKRDISRVFYRIDDAYIEINDEMLIHDGRDRCGGIVLDHNGIHDDVIIYELKKEYNAFKLSGETVNIGDELAMRSYRRNTGNENGIVCENKMCRVTALKKGLLKNKTYNWENCFIADNIYNSGKRIGGFNPGNSGSALFNKDTVYGILITANRNGFGTFGTFIEAEYIKDVIDKVVRGGLGRTESIPYSQIKPQCSCYGTPSSIPFGGGVTGSHTLYRR